MNDFWFLSIHGVGRHPSDQPLGEVYGSANSLTQLRASQS